MPSVAGAVLAGGRSRRMGSDKALVERHGRPLARSVLDALDGAAIDPRVVVGGDAARLAVLGVEVVADAFPGEGPLGGVVTALDHFAAVAARVMVVACDLPDIGGGALGPLLECLELRADGPPDVAVARAGTVQPMCALWSTSLAGSLRASFEDGERSMFGALDRLRAQRARIEVVDVPPASLRNINAPNQLGG
jgi:molybdopterin-guanine dinucleotide biosynthesis protein A